MILSGVTKARHLRYLGPYTNVLLLLGRVGAFGFLASEEIRTNGDLNVGLLDQRKYVRTRLRFTTRH